MPSFANPDYFIPSVNAAASQSAFDMVNQGLSSLPSQINPVQRVSSGFDKYLHITIPVVLRSGARGITQGGYLDKDGLGAENHYGWIQNEWLEKFSPRAWRRTATAWSFDPRTVDKYNMLFWKSGKDEKGQLNGLGRGIQKQLTKAASLEGGGLDENHWIRKSGILTRSGELAHWWDPRMMARISASGDFAKMDTLSAKNVAGLTNYLKAGANEGLATTIGGIEGDILGKDAAMATRLGVSGAFSGRLMGSMESLRFGGDGIDAGLSRLGADRDTLNESVRAGLNWGDKVRPWGVDASGQKLAFRDITSGRAVSQAGADAAASAARTAGTDVGEAVAKTAGTDIAKKLGARLAIFGAEATGAIAEGGLNPVMDILAIASLAQLGFDIGHFGAELAGNAIKSAATSYRGDVNKVPGRGFGFHETVASATSRQRGVQAIASSRLNARSILGNEAGVMYNHFMGSEMGY